jgi:HlyD family secretion protein
MLSDCEIEGSRIGVLIPKYVTAPATKGNLTVIVTSTGAVQPTNEVDVSGELSGTIRKVLADYNDKVKVGQPLAGLDTDNLKATVESSRAKLAATKARTKEAEATVIEKNSIMSASALWKVLSH